ncbi:dienelactone hydrolase family protein, partial [bacterium]|nr:dienelactone hydrolase family protein [bacterium]
MRARRGIGCLAIVIGLLVTRGATHAHGEELCTLKSDPSQEYYVYLPSDHDPEKTYWLFVGVHGLGGKGKGALGWAKFADEGQCIVVGPTFKGTYQFPSTSNTVGKNMIAIFKEMSRKYKLQRKFFLTGFSAGGQFSHRFALAMPQLVLACAPHSPGSWSKPNAKARAVPFVVTCGEADTSRIDIAKTFVQQCKQLGYQVTSEWYEGVGHSMCGDCRKITKEFYFAATNGMPLELYRKALACLEEGDTLITDHEYGKAVTELNKLARSKRKGALFDKARAKVAEIEKAGRGKLAAIEDNAATDPDKASAELAAFCEAYQGARVGAAAATTLKKLKAGQPPTPAAVKTPATPTAPKPPATTKQPASNAKRWLSLARNFLANDSKAPAARYLNKIVQPYPNS